jgi:hypothetical protein
VAVTALAVLGGVVLLPGGSGGRGGAERSGYAIDPVVGQYDDVVAYIESTGFRLPADQDVVTGMAEVICPFVDGTWWNGSAMHEARRWFVRHEVWDAGGALTQAQAERLFDLLVQGCVAGRHASVVGLAVVDAEDGR